MPKLSGIFDQFKFLYQVPHEEINFWLKKKQDPHFISNYLGNRILYPQTIPMSKDEMEIDLSILRAVIKKYPQKFYDSKLKKIVVPYEFSIRFLPAVSLIAAFIDGLSLTEKTDVYFESVNNRQKLASVIYIPEKIPNNKVIEVYLSSQKFLLRVNTLTLLPVETGNYKLKIDPSEEISLTTGGIGIFIDLRKKE